MKIINLLHDTLTWFKLNLKAKGVPATGTQEAWRTPVGAPDDTRPRTQGNGGEGSTFDPDGGLAC